MADLPDDVSQRVDGELFAGRKIQAIKLYREATGCSLRDAKEAVDAREAKLRAVDPTRFVATGKAGCMGMIALSILPAAIGLLLR